MKKKISVIVPTFGNSEFLFDCLYSISNQNFDSQLYDFNILLGIDNCEESKIEVLKLLPLYNNLQAFLFEQNVGPYIVKNTLAQHCDADYIIFFDSDDIMPPYFVQNVVARLNHFSMVLFYYKNFVEIREDNHSAPTKKNDRTSISNFLRNHRVKNEKSKPRKSFIERLKANLQTGYLTNKMLYINIFYRKVFNIYTSGVFAIRKDDFIKLNGYKPWPVDADSEIILRAYINRIKQVYLSKKFAFARRIHPKSLTLNHNTGEGTEIRNLYHSKILTSIYENSTIVTYNNFTQL